jgi:hypothetical protein
LDWTPGRTKKYPTAHRLDVRLERFAVEARLHGEKACGEVQLKADEQEPHVEVTGVGDGVVD